MSKCEKPCKECPFKKSSIPGYLGPLSHRPEEYLQMMEQVMVVCHLVTKPQQPCIGALSHCANSMKIPRGARDGGRYSKLIDKAKKNKDVFQWPHEFIKHHSPKTS